MTRLIDDESNEDPKQIRQHQRAAQEPTPADRECPLAAAPQDRIRTLVDGVECLGRELRLAGYKAHRVTSGARFIGASAPPVSVPLPKTTCPPLTCLHLREH